MIGLKMDKIKTISDYLDKLYPNLKCELIYNRDYELLISVVLSSQSSDKIVNIVAKELWAKFDLKGLANANITDIEEILKPIGIFRRKASYIIQIANILIEKYNGTVPNNIESLESFPGVGRKTANVVLGLLYNYPSIAVDTHVKRVSKRLNLANQDDSVFDIENKLMRCFEKNTWVKRHHQMVIFGRYKCKAINPLCSDCELKNICKEKR